MTWKASSYEKQELKIALKFNDPTELSPMIIKDRLIFYFKEPRDFFVSNKFVKLDARYYRLEHMIKK